MSSGLGSSLQRDYEEIDTSSKRKKKSEMMPAKYSSNAPASNNMIDSLRSNTNTVTDPSAPITEVVR